MERAELRRWGSLWRWDQAVEPAPRLLAPWPVPRLPNWVDRVNLANSEQELEAIRKCIRRGSPLGNAAWVESTAQRLHLESTLRPRGRPPLDDNKSKNKES